MSKAKQTNQMIDIAIAANAIPRRKGSQTILPLGQRRDLLGQTVLAGEITGRNSSYAVLADQFSKLTKAGEYYYSKTDHALPDAKFDRNQPLIHKGASDYVVVANGKKTKSSNIRRGREHNIDCTW